MLKLLKTNNFLRNFSFLNKSIINNSKKNFSFTELEFLKSKIDTNSQLFKVSLIILSLLIKKRKIMRILKT